MIITLLISTVLRFRPKRYENILGIALLLSLVWLYKFHCVLQMDSRIPFLNSGGYPISPLLAFQSFPDPAPVKSASQPSSGAKASISIFLCLPLHYFESFLISFRVAIPSNRLHTQEAGCIYSNCYLS